MPKSGETMPTRVTRSLRSRVISCDMESIKSDSDGIVENEVKSSGISTPRATRSRRNSQTEATPPAKSSPFVRLRRYTSMSELNPAAVSSPVRRSSRNLRSSLAEADGSSTIDSNRNKSPLNFDIVPEEDEHEIENVSQRIVTRSSSKSPGNVSNAKKIITEVAETGTPSALRRGRPKKIVQQTGKETKKAETTTESKPRLKERSLSIESNELLLTFSPEKESMENSSSGSAMQSISKKNIKDETLLKDDKGNKSTNSRSDGKTQILFEENVEDLAKINSEIKLVAKSLNSTKDQFSPKAEQLIQRNDSEHVKINDINDNNKIDKNDKNPESVEDTNGEAVEEIQIKEEKCIEQTPMQTVDPVEKEQENSSDNANELQELSSAENIPTVDELCASHIDTSAKTTTKENSSISVSSVEDEQSSLRDGCVIALDLDDDIINKEQAETNKERAVMVEDSEMVDAKEKTKLLEKTELGEGNEESSGMASALDKSPNDKMEVGKDDTVVDDLEGEAGNVEDMQKDNSMIKKGVAQKEEIAQSNSEENFDADKTKESFSDKIEHSNVADVEMNETQDKSSEELVPDDTIPESNPFSGNTPNDCSAVHKTGTSLLDEDVEMGEATAASEIVSEPETRNDAQIEVLDRNAKTEAETKGEDQASSNVSKDEAVSKSDFVRKIIGTLQDFGQKLNNGPQENSADRKNKLCLEGTTEKSDIMFTDESLNETIDEDIKKILDSPLKDFEEDTNRQDMLKLGSNSAETTLKCPPHEKPPETTNKIDATEKHIAAEKTERLANADSAEEENLNGKKTPEKELNSKTTLLGHEKLSEVKTKAKADCSTNSTPIGKTNLSSSTPIGKSKKELQTNNSAKSESRRVFSKSWIQTVVGSGSGEAAAYIDALDVEKRNSSDSNIIIKRKHKKPMILISSDESDDEYEKNSLIDDEVEVVNEDEDSMSTDEREYLDMNEIPVWGESLGSDDTEEFLDEEDNGERDSLDSFIVTEDEDKNTMSIGSNEFSSENDSVDMITPKKNQSTSRKNILSSDEEIEEDFDTKHKKKNRSKRLDSTDNEDEVYDVAEQPNNDEDAAENLLENEPENVIHPQVEEEGNNTTVIADTVEAASEQRDNVSENAAKEKSKKSKHDDEGESKKSNMEEEKHHNPNDEGSSVNDKRQNHPGSRNRIPNASCSFEYSLTELFYEDDDFSNKQSGTQKLKSGTEKKSKPDIQGGNAQIESVAEVHETETNIRREKDDALNSTFTSCLETRTTQIHKALDKAYELLLDLSKVIKKEGNDELAVKKKKSLDEQLLSNGDSYLNSASISSALASVRLNRKRKLSAGKNFIKNASGIFIEEEVIERKKFMITSKFETRSGTIYEQIASPIGKRNVNNFEESRATPRALGYNVQQIPMVKNCSDGRKKFGTKRKLTLQEPSSCLPKPKWMTFNQFLNNASSHVRSIDEDFIPLTIEKTSTEFRVASLRTKKNKQGDVQHLSTSKALEFKNKSLYNQRIKRGTAKDLLMRKEKQNVYNKL